MQHTINIHKHYNQRKKLGQHYLLIDSYESKNAIVSGSPISSIALYIPPNSLQYSHGANYEVRPRDCLVRRKSQRYCWSRWGIERNSWRGMGSGSAEAKTRGIVGLVNPVNFQHRRKCTNVLSATQVAVNNHGTCLSWTQFRFTFF